MTRGRSLGPRRAGASCLGTSARPARTAPGSAAPRHRRSTSEQQPPRPRSPSRSCIFANVLECFQRFLHCLALLSSSEVLQPVSKCRGSARCLTLDLPGVLLGLLDPLQRLRRQALGRPLHAKQVAEAGVHAEPARARGGGCAVNNKGGEQYGQVRALAALCSNSVTEDGWSSTS